MLRFLLLSVNRSSDEELEYIWPVSDNDYIIYDNIPPLKFTIVQLPPTATSPPAAANSRSTSATVLDESGMEDNEEEGHESRTAQVESIQSEDEDVVEADNNEEGGRNDDEDKKKEKKNKENDKSATLQEDIHSFIKVVKDRVQDNDSIRKAFDKVLSHIYDKHDNNDVNNQHSEDVDVAAAIREEAGKLDPMTAGIVSALLAPALMGPPPPLHHPHHGRRPPFPPHLGGGRHGGPPEFHHPHHPFGPPPFPYGGPDGRGRDRHGMPPRPPFFEDGHLPPFGGHHHHRGPAGFGGRPPFTGLFGHGRYRDFPYTMPPHFHHAAFDGMMPGLPPFGGRHGPPGFGPRGRPEDDPRFAMFGFFGGPGPHRHGRRHAHRHHGRHTRFFDGEKDEDAFDELSGDFEAMQMNGEGPARNDSSTTSSDTEDSDIEYIDDVRFRGPPPPPAGDHNKRAHGVPHAPSFFSRMTSQGRRYHGGHEGRPHGPPGSGHGGRGGPPPPPRHGDIPPPPHHHHHARHEEARHGRHHISHRGRGRWA